MVGHMDSDHDRKRKALPAWWREMEDHFSGSHEGSIALHEAGDTLADRVSEAVWAAAELDGERLRQQAAGARRVLELLGLAPHLDAAIRRMRDRDAQREEWADDPVTLVDAGAYRGGGKGQA